MAIDFERNLTMSIAPETAYNTYIATGHQGIHILPGSRFAPLQPWRQEPSARGLSAESPYDMTPGLRGWSYDCTALLPKEALGHILYHMFGAVVSATITTWTKHTFSINKPAVGTSATPKSASIRMLDDNAEWHLSGGVLTKLTLRMLLENFWQVEMNWIGGTWVDAALGTAITYTVPTNRHYLLSDDFEFRVDGATGSAANWAASTFEVTFQRNYADGPAESYEAGSNERVRMESAGNPAAIMVTGQTTRIYDGSTQYDLFDVGTQFRVEARSIIKSGENLVAPASDGYCVQLMLEKCYLTEWEKSPASGINMQRLNFKATYTAAADMQMITQDKLATPVSVGTPGA